MSCPRCLCSTSSEVTISSDASSRTYLECDRCGYLRASEGIACPLVEVGCPHCARSVGVEAYLPSNAELTGMTCRVCGTPWTVL